MKMTRRPISWSGPGQAKMVDENRYCVDFLTQINATTAALGKVAPVCWTATFATA
jgi:DNA-binding FrmR family transcriptional regulator